MKKNEKGILLGMVLVLLTGGGVAAGVAMSNSRAENPVPSVSSGGGGGGTNNGSGSASGGGGSTSSGGGGGSRSGSSEGSHGDVSFEVPEIYF